jgi:hypothetical protein
MSGGSMEYLCFKVDEAADRLTNEKNPARRAFGEHLKKVAHALHEIEWVDSGDKSSPDDINAIRDVLADDYRQREIGVLIGDAKELIQQMRDLGVTDAGPE